ncbi:hypothetical protein D1007_15787 [Hordeum vulgare]|nr:hypothetical protein D1007_15787 [Hordeum vulgare]
MMMITLSYYDSELIVPYTSTVIHNHCSKMNATTKDVDIEETLNYFCKVKETDPMFFFKCKMDAEGKTNNLFLVNGAARKAYAEAYHDCVSFDATYLTNMYNIPLHPSLASTGYGQSIMLGSGFIWARASL